MSPCFNLPSIRVYSQHNSHSHLFRTCVCMLSRSVMSFSFATPWTVARQGSIHGILQVRLLEGVAIPFSQGLPDPGIKSGSPALQADFLSIEPSGKPFYGGSNGKTHITEFTGLIILSIWFHSIKYSHHDIQILSLIFSRRLLLPPEETFYPWKSS